MRLLVIMTAVLLTACGFHLRGQGAFAMPFQKLYVQSPNDYTPFINDLKSAFQRNHVQITESPEQAQLTLQIVSEVADKQILSLNSAGRVIEYRLQYHISLRAYDQQQHDWIAPQEITLLRNFPYDDTQILAKQQEEALLYQNMRVDAVEQVLRRMNHAHPILVAPE